MINGGEAKPHLATLVCPKNQKTKLTYQKVLKILLELLYSLKNMICMR